MSDTSGTSLPPAPYPCVAVVMGIYHHDTVTQYGWRFQVENKVPLCTQRCNITIKNLTSNKERCNLSLIVLVAEVGDGGTVLIPSRFKRVPPAGILPEIRLLIGAPRSSGDKGAGVRSTSKQGHRRKQINHAASVCTLTSVCLVCCC